MLGKVEAIELACISEHMFMDFSWFWSEEYTPEFLKYFLITLYMIHNIVSTNNCLN